MRLWRHISSVTVLGIVCSSTLAFPAYASEETPSSSLKQLITDYAPEEIPVAETDMESGRFEAKIDRTEVAIDSGSSAKIEITDSSGTARLVPLPNKSLSEGKESSEGSVHYEVEDGTRLIAQPLQDASVRLSVAITDASQPQEFSTI